MLLASAEPTPWSGATVTLGFLAVAVALSLFVIELNRRQPRIWPGLVATATYLVGFVLILWALGAYRGMLPPAL